MSRAMTVLGLICVALSFASAEPRFPGGYMNDGQPGRVITPHLAWARPWAPGTIRVFFLSPGYMAPAELNELWERLDITYEAVVGRSHYLPYDLNVEASDQWNRIVIGTNPGEKQQELRDKLARDYDVYCFSGFEWNAVPSWVWCCGR